VPFKKGRRLGSESFFPHVCFLFAERPGDGDLSPGDLRFVKNMSERLAQSEGFLHFSWVQMESAGNKMDYGQKI